MLTSAAARTQLRHLRLHPKPLARPVLVLSGWGDPGIIVRQLAQVIGRTSGDVRVTDRSFFWDFTMQACRAKVVNHVQALWPNLNEDETIEVDVVAHSMGGLIARYAALPADIQGFDSEFAPLGRRLRIHTLHTVGTPHLGANLAKLFHRIDPRAKAMMKDSFFLKALNSAPAAHAIVSYGIEGDWVVGLENATPQGVDLRRFPRRSMLHPSHAGATSDPRILLEIIRQLQGE